MSRVFLIVLDSVGVGELPDAADFGDEGSNTLRAAATSKAFAMPNMEKLGLFHIDGLDEVKKMVNSSTEKPEGTYAKLAEKSRGKDTTVGHWEIAGLISEQPLPTFPQGFPKDLLDKLEEKTGRKILCNLPYSGTDVIRDYGREHVETGALIVYTSADSVLQIAAHNDVVPLEELYHYCEMARELCVGEYGVGRVIARPFTGNYPEFKRTADRHDYSLVPPGDTMLTQMKDAGLDVLSVGKIIDIFAKSGITDYVRSHSNAEGIELTIDWMKRDFNGLCFTNLVDFDMIYGHRNDVEGYAKALTYFDEQLPRILSQLKDDDILMITADHGCDPATPSTDHSREYIPLIAYGKKVKADNNLGIRTTYSDIGATILAYFGVKQKIAGTSFLSELINN